ncbi:MAG TPA: DUF6232 family protein [Micromonosporaceae bacterium]|nr:DUF6232 family protein [Micromonosporaceae bacterium]
MNATHGPPRPPSNVTFLDQRGVRITGCWFDVSGERFAVRELERVWEAPRPPDPAAVNAARVTVLMLVLGGLAVPFVDWRGWLGLGTVITVTLLVAAVTLRVRRRPRQIWARYRGMSVPLFGSADPLWFNQVYRALSRALRGDDDGAI